MPRSGLETVRDHAGETLGACSSGYWGTFVYRDDDFGNASAVEFPAYYVSLSSASASDVVGNFSLLSFSISLYFPD